MTSAAFDGFFVREKFVHITIRRPIACHACPSHVDRARRPSAIALFIVLRRRFAGPFQLSCWAPLVALRGLPLARLPLSLQAFDSLLALVLRRPSTLVSFAIVMKFYFIPGAPFSNFFRLVQDTRAMARDQFAATHALLAAFEAQVMVAWRKSRRVSTT